MLWLWISYQTTSLPTYRFLLSWRGMFISLVCFSLNLQVTSKSTVVFLSVDIFGNENLNWTRELFKPDSNKTNPYFKMSRRMTKTNKKHVRPVKNLIRLGVYPGWSESSLGALVICWFCPPEESLSPSLPIECTAKTLIRLGGWPGCLRWAHRLFGRFGHAVAQMSQVMRLWHFSSSVNSFFKRACAAIQWG